MADKKETDKKINTTKKSKDIAKNRAKNVAESNKKNTGEGTTKNKTKSTTNNTKKDIAKSTTKNTKKDATKSTTKNAKKDTVKTTKKNPKKEITDKEEAEKEETVAIVKEESSVKIEEIKETIKEKKALPKEEAKKINKVLFRNIVIAGLIIIYFMFLNLGFVNIKDDVFITDLKVFGMCILLLAIALIENSYKKENGEIALYGIEMVVLAIITIGLIYVKLMFSSRYVYIASAISYIFAIYYVVKSIVIYIKKKKQYFVNDMKEIMKKEE